MGIIYLRDIRVIKVNYYIRVRKFCKVRNSFMIIVNIFLLNYVVIKCLVFYL